MAQFVSIEKWDKTTQIINLDQVTRFYIDSNNVYMEFVTVGTMYKFDRQ